MDILGYLINEIIDLIWIIRPIITLMIGMFLMSFKDVFSAFNLIGPDGRMSPAQTKVAGSLKFIGMLMLFAGIFGIGMKVIDFIRAVLRILMSGF